MTRAKIAIIAVVIASAAALTLLPRAAAAHCDSMDGPVVKAGLLALDTGKLEPALIWVPKSAEPELRTLYKKIVKARKKGATVEVVELLERYFLETLVRLHRESEGEPYTGLKPAGTAIEPGLEEADAAIASGSVDDLAATLRDALTKELRVRFASVKRRGDWTGLAEGRAFVRAYVEYVHYVANVHAAIVGRHGEAH